MSKLKQLREQKNLTQEELSETSGISVRTIQRIEAGTAPKGFTLKTLAKVLEIPEQDLLPDILPVALPDQEAEVFLKPEQTASRNDSKIKLINLSSIPFILLPPLNILVPLLLIHALKQQSSLSRQILSLQILWTILAPIVFMLGIFLKLGNRFTLVLIILILLSNIFMILRNAFEIDKNNKLYFKLNFNII